MIKNAFISPYKLFLFVRYLIFCPDIFGHVGTRIDKEIKVNLKIYDVTTWLKNKFNIDIEV